VVDADVVYFICEIW